MATDAAKVESQVSTPGVGSGGEIVVMKFGGTSVADAERIKRAAGGSSPSASGATASWLCCRRAARRPTS